jgi:NitT/TauT family transport system substrate-binding protein
MERGQDRRQGYRHRLAAALALWFAAAPIALANETVRVVHTSSSTYTAGFVALDKGFFAAHGLDVSFIPTAINSNIPAALVSGSAEIGGPSTAVLIQAVDGGLGLLAIAGTGLAYPGGTNEAAVARLDAGIHAPADYIGRRVGVPGIGVISDIFFRNWLIAHDVDPAKVIYAEVANPLQFDALRSGSVDAVVANDPQLYRLVHSGVGVEAGRFLEALPGTIPIIVYAVTPDYAAHHRATVLAFQAAHREGVAYVEQHPDEARAILARHLHLSDDVVKDMEMPKFQADISPEEIGRMIDIMQRLNMLQGHPDPAAMVFR